MKPSVSVVVCTYNRADVLVHALRSLCDQSLDASQYELIAVDNNSQDNTREFIEGFCRRYPQVRYCLEKQQGLSHARNRGWRESRGGYVAYVDDDCKVPDDWLEKAFEVLTRLSPAVFGGPYYGYYNSPKPGWWKERYGSFEHSETDGALAQGTYLRGGNIFFQRAMLEAVGGFDCRYGMVGEKLAYAEETDLQKRIRSAHPDALIHYEPTLLVYHLVRPEKMTLRWNVTSHFRGGRSYYHVDADNSLQVPGPRRITLLAQMATALLNLAGGLGVALLWRDRKRFPRLQNYVYEVSFAHLQHLGFMYERYVDSKRKADEP